ncbi:MAG: hypothetical protein AAGJ19_21680 [Myxococcota bacterium]
MTSFARSRVRPWRRSDVSTKAHLIRVTPEEHALNHAPAEAAGESLSELVRRLVARGAKRLKVSQPD